MITNPQEDPNQSADKNTEDQLLSAFRAQEIPAEEITKTVAHALADGTSAAIMAFVRVNRVNVKPGTRCDNPLREFALRLVQEFNDSPTKDEDTKLHPYPFKDSLKERMLEVIQSPETLPLAIALHAAGEDENLNKLFRVIGAGETLKFLDAHRPEVLKLIAEIRGDDIVQKDDSSPVK